MKINSDIERLAAFMANAITISQRDSHIGAALLEIAREAAREAKTAKLIDAALKRRKARLLKQAEAKKAPNEQAKVWGPPAWKAFHKMCDDFDKQGITDIKVISKAIREWRSDIQCGECKTSFSIFLIQNKPTPGNLFAWSVMMHNKVNTKIGYKELSLEEARKAQSL